MSHNATLDPEIAARRQKKMEQIKKLIDQANGTPYEEEAATFRAQAERLMVAYRISETDIKDKSRPRDKPIMKEGFLVVSDRGSLIREQTIDLFCAVMQFTHCRGAFLGLQGDGPCTGKIVGYAEDIEYLDLLFTGLSLQLSKAINPQVDDKLSRGENIYRMKAAGLTWEEIFRRLDVPFMEEDGVTKTKWHSVLMREYKAHCAENLLKPITAQPKTWVRNFSTAWVQAVTERFHEIIINQSIAAMNEADKEAGQYALVLRDRNAMVDDAYAHYFPNIRHGGAPPKQGKFLHDARFAGHEAGRAADLGTGGSVRGGGGRKELGS